MPTGCRAEQLEFEGAGGRRVIADFAGGAMTSDAGTLLLRHGDRTSGLIDRAAGCFVDYRSPDFIVHGLPALVGQRIAGMPQFAARPPAPSAAGCSRSAPW